jgi:ABC-2 type transport system permease protein
MEKVIVILQKEWAEIFKNRMVIFTVLFLPLMMALLPLVVLVVTPSDVSMADTGMNLPSQFSAYCPPEAQGGACMQIFLMSQFMVLFLITPLSIPATIAAYSIIGEKTTRSLEPLLATPITTLELLLGKILSALIPAVLATYGGFIIFIAGVGIIAEPVVFKGLLSIHWLLAVGVVGPLLAMLSVTFGLMVSARVTDARVAEQISMVIILPLMAVFIGQMAGLFILNNTVILVSALVLALVDIGMVYLAVEIFERESILTRWK